MDIEQRVTILEEKVEKLLSKNKRKHPFEKSPIYDEKAFCEKFPDWGPNKLKHWYSQAVTYSGANGGRYLDWGLAVASWEKKTPYKEPVDISLAGY